MAAPVLLSIQVGLPRRFGRDGALDPMDRPWTTGFCKEPVAGPVWVGKVNLEGDGQADLVNHGGPDKAVCAYSADHHGYWCRELRQPGLPGGAFGENFTVKGLAEPDVCLGDVWAAGGVTLQVSQPRQPCWKLARRWRVKALALQAQQTGRTGWYFRVLAEGAVSPGSSLVLVERPHPGWTVERANRVMHHDRDDLRAAAELAALPVLAGSWRATLARRAEQNVNPDTSRRLVGPNEE